MKLIKRPWCGATQIAPYGYGRKCGQCVACLRWWIEPQTLWDHLRAFGQRLKRLKRLFVRDREWWEDP